MYGFLLRPRWLAFHLLVIGAVVLMINLGFWQLRRLDERRDFNAVVAERSELAPQPLDELLGDLPSDPDARDAALDALEWRQVTAEGSWLGEQVLWFNRTQDGIAGDNVLTGLAERSGTTVVVNRGFVPLATETPSPPDGEVAVLGRLRLPHERQRGELTDAGDGPVTEVRRVDLDQLAGQLPGELAPVYVDLIATDPPVTDSDPTPVPMADLTEGSHLSYAFQWFIFAGCVVIGWVLAVRRSIGTRRREAARATSPGSGSATDPVSDVPAAPSDGTARSRSASDAPDRASGTPSRR